MTYSDSELREVQRKAETINVELAKSNLADVKITSSSRKTSFSNCSMMRITMADGSHHVAYRDTHMGWKCNNIRVKCFTVDATKQQALLSVAETGKVERIHLSNEKYF